MYTHEAWVFSLTNRISVNERIFDSHETCSSESCGCLKFTTGNPFSAALKRELCGSLSTNFIFSLLLSLQEVLRSCNGLRYSHVVSRGSIIKSASVKMG